MSSVADHGDSRTVTDAMIEAAGRALCDLENERDYQAAAQGHRGDLGTTGYVELRYEDWQDEYDEQARAALIAALGAAS